MRRKLNGGEGSIEQTFYHRRRARKQAKLKPGLEAA